MQRLLIAVCTFILFLSGIYEVITFRVTVITKLMYLSSLIVAIFYFFSSSHRLNAFHALILLLFFVFLSLVLGLQYADQLYYLSDAIVLLGCFFYFYLYRSNRRSLELLVDGVFYCSLLFMALNFFAEIYRVNGRFPVMSPYIFGLFILMDRSSGWARVLKSILSVFVLLIVTFGGSRTALIGGFFFFFSRYFKNNTKVLVVATIILLFLVILLHEYLWQIFQNTKIGARFGSAIKGEDYSVLQRFLEIKDVLGIVISSYSSGGAEWLLGHGSGATFDPVFSYSKNNILADGSVHHLHATPFAILFRYGLIGVILWFLFLFWIFWKVFMNFLLTKNPFFLVAIAFIILDQSMRNVLVNPLFFVFVSYVSRGDFGKSS